MVVYDDNTVYPVPNFSLAELYSRSPDAPQQHWIDDDVVNALQAIRDWCGVPIVVTSTYRTPEHNGAVGGSMNSMHLEGRAIDFAFMEDNEEWIAELQRHIKYDGVMKEVLLSHGIRGFGYYDNFVHIDTRLVDGSDMVTWGDGIEDVFTAISEDGYVPAIRTQVHNNFAWVLGIGLVWVITRT